VLILSFNTPPHFKIRTTGSMPFELQGWIQKSLEKMLFNFNYCIFEATLNEEDLHAQIQITAEGKGVLVRINKRLKEIGTYTQY